MEEAKSDLDDLFRIYGDPATNTFNTAGPYPDIQHAQTVLARWINHWETHSFGNWAIKISDVTLHKIKIYHHEQ